MLLCVCVGAKRKDYVRGQAGACSLMFFNQVA